MQRGRDRLRNREVAAAGSFSPSILFGAGEQGVWYDPSDMATLFQDDAGLTPVTAAGQIVGLILDKSGNGNHATQATGASKPILRNTGGLWYLEFDGIDDAMTTAAINFTVTNKLTLFAGIRKLSDSATGVMAELSPNLGTNPGSFAVRAPNGASSADYQVNWSGSTVETANIGLMAAPHTAVISSTADIATSIVDMRINGSASGLVKSGALGTGNFGNYQLFVGRRSGGILAFKGYFYGFVVRAGIAGGSAISSAERYFAAKSGVTI
jgi:hypothetical protein